MPSDAGATLGRQLGIEIFPEVRLHLHAIVCHLPAPRVVASAAAYRAVGA